MGMSDKASNIKSGNEKQLGNSGFQLRANIDWASFTAGFANVKNEDLYKNLERLLLQMPVSSVNQNAIEKMANSNTRESYIQSTAIALMSTPEYQLC